jgi:O-antigen ligase
MALLIVATISRIHQHFGPIAALRPVLLLVMLAGAYAYLHPRFLVQTGVLRTLPAKAMVALGAMACLSVPLAISIGNSGQFILQEYSKTLLLGLLVIAAIRNARDLYTLVWAFVLSVGALSYLSLFVFQMARAGSTMRIAGGYTYDANDIGTVAIVGMAMTLLVLQVSRGWQKGLAVGILLGAGATLAKTGSRGAFIGLLVIGAAMLVLMRQVRLDKRIAFLLVVALGLFIAAPQGYWEQMRTIFAPTADYNWTSPTGRKAVFERGIGYMMTNPVTGIGVDNFPRAEGLISARAREHMAGSAGIKWSAAHNSFLQAAAEMGIPGLLLFGGLVFGSAAAVIRVRRTLPRAWLTGRGEERFIYLATMYLPVALIGFAAAGAFVSFAYADLVYVLCAFAAGTMECARAKLSDAAAGHSPTTPVLPSRKRRVGGLAAPRRT